MEEVDLIASGYEWICPECDHRNTEIEIREEVVCKECGEICEVNQTHHAYG
jgi:transcription initiation factor TFIIIB Brf1 subunit/transcription initiation factor TFIIB